VHAKLFDEKKGQKPQVTVPLS